MNHDAASSTAERVALFSAAEAMLPGDRSIYRDPDAGRFVRDSKLRFLISRRRRARALLAVLDALTPGLAGQAFVRYRVHIVANRVTRTPAIAQLDELTDGAVLDVPGSPRVIHAPSHGEPWTDGVKRAVTVTRVADVEPAS